MKISILLSKILRNPRGFFQEIQDNLELKEKAIFSLIASFLLFSSYGFILGLNNSFMQGLSSAIKLPFLFLITSLICFPTLFIFSILFGDKKSFLQYLSVLLSALSVISLLLVAFAPIVIFFMITSNHYLFFKTINVVIFVISGVAGLKFFYRGIQYEESKEDSEKKARSKILEIWMVLFGFVGSQMAWILRPFFGAPELPFELFRRMEGNFYFNLLETIKNIIGA